MITSINEFKKNLMYKDKISTIPGDDYICHIYVDNQGDYIWDIIAELKFTTNEKALSWLGTKLKTNIMLQSKMYTQMNPNDTVHICNLTLMGKEVMNIL